ncbi:energy transducer TonB [Acidiphilium acidophilum]|uniref:energy transducer TonB n=1 Tax=Acidiphilium acidophilum TaxID=76588 RepID=UPI002156D0AC|nr:hypothetical protein [Acidiphilium acidophilum]GBQ25266.1 hypothetical protein AA700_1541 [Acidiphilium acidophilum DSM 700]
MKTGSTFAAGLLLGTGLLVCSLSVAGADDPGSVGHGDWYSSTVIRPAPGSQYRGVVDRVLFDTFGHGGTGRNLYCEGPAIVRFRIAPDGKVSGARLVKPSLTAVNARLLATISNLRFPAFPAGMTVRSLTVTFRYGIWDLARPYLAARTNCR